MHPIAKELQLVQGRKKSFGPKDVVDFARAHPGSYIWQRFESAGMWDDTKAADIAREAFAQLLIRKYRVRIRGNDGEPYAVRVSISVPEMRGEKPSYVQRAVVLSSAEYRQQLLQQAAIDLQNWLTKYCDMVPAGVMTQIKVIAREVEAMASGSQYVDAGD